MDHTADTAWPVKRRDLHNHHMDSTWWDRWDFRDDDIVIATYAKSGTTWTQQIVAQLLFDGAVGLRVHEMSLWLDLRTVPAQAKAAMAAQTTRRFVKTHLPVDALVFSPKAKYIYVCRDGRDSVWSFYNHHINATDEYFSGPNDTPGRVGPPIERGTRDAHGFYQDWFAGDGFPYWSFWENVRSWWEIRHLPNVMLLHFNDMKADLPGTIRRVASFLQIPINQATFPTIVEHCGFDYMKANADQFAPGGGAPWQGGAGTFIHKGTNDRWRDTLSQAEVNAYDARAIKELGQDGALWLANGGPVA